MVLDDTAMPDKIRCANRKTSEADEQTIESEVMQYAVHGVRVVSDGERATVLGTEHVLDDAFSEMLDSE